MLSFEDIVRFVRVLRSRFEVSKVRITGGEPLVRPDIVRLTAMLAREGVADLALTTNGQCLAELAEDLRGAGLQRVNVSLDTLDAETFRSLTRGGELSRTLDGIDAALRHGLKPVKINTVAMRPYNEREVVRIARFGLDKGCQVRFLELMPISRARAVFGDLFVPFSGVYARLAQSFCLEPLACEAGRTSRDFLASDASGRRGIIGFISPQTQPFCTGCNRLRLTSWGRLVWCLARGDGPNVKESLRDDSPAATRALCTTIAAQLDRKACRRAFRTTYHMAAVGG
jgi:cyclic pyranopterin phosphate synthase